MVHHSSSQHVRVRTRLAAALVAGVLTVGMVSCGSRTGLFGPEADFFSGDASADRAADAWIDAGRDGAVPCTPGRFTFELALTQLMFVIDRSGSMAFDLSGVQDRPRSEWRWSVLQSSLRKTITTFDEQIAMGAKFFPEIMTQADLRDSQRACRSDTGVGIGPARGNANAILDVFDRSTPRGGTPTSEAIRAASNYLRTTRSVARTIVLATDGAPNCNGALDAETCVCTSTSSCASDPSRGRFSCLDDSRTIDTIRDTSENGRIPVYVIGIGGTEAPEFLQVLDDMAVAGGRPRQTLPRHYNVQSEADLTAALTTIRDSVSKCTYLTPSAPTDPNDIAVQIDGVAIARDQTKRDGWDWVDQEFGELAFFGEACTRAQGAGGPPAVVSGVVRCEP
ncbi:MAG TPA: vWA domain-containing protein [Labilithrix sp.]|jgi:hypothetical protein|nr:vWA domain-containing protein [Labilithrix sp.]